MILSLQLQSIPYNNYDKVFSTTCGIFYRWMQMLGPRRDNITEESAKGIKGKERCEDIRRTARHDGKCTLNKRAMREKDR